MNYKDKQRPLAEERFREELEAIAAQDGGRKPPGWKLSPRGVRTFILGSDKSLALEGRKVKITKKFYGDDALVERAIVTLAENRGLMLVGEPGTAKSMLSELLAAAVSGNSANTIQGTAGTSEDGKSSWGGSQGKPGRSSPAPGLFFRGGEAQGRTLRRPLAGILRKRESSEINGRMPHPAGVGTGLSA
jgi:hypothetical protein